MRAIQPDLTAELQEFIGDRPVDKAPAYRIGSYRELMEIIAKLSFLNKDHLLFFRGQNVDHQTRTEASTFYPSIYRRDPLQKSELKILFSISEDAERQLAEIFKSRRIEGWKEVVMRRPVKWSILQHYGVCSTPLLDFTHSIRVACSFAQLDSKDEFVYVYAFGLPYVTNRISFNTEQNILNVRLISICPPDAIRPYFQDAYLAGTEDILDEYEDKSELDFRHRLVAKFQIPNSSDFWGQHFEALPRGVLYPTNDQMEELCKGIVPVARERGLPEDVGTFLTEWSKIERRVFSNAREFDRKVRSLAQAMKVLRMQAAIDPSTFKTLDMVRHFRNKVAHQPFDVTSDEIARHLDIIGDLENRRI